MHESHDDADADVHDASVRNEVKDVAEGQSRGFERGKKAAFDAHAANHGQNVGKVVGNREVDVDEVD